MLGIIAVILVFGGLIFFHELGHFLVARSFSMGVRTFSLGFGPALFSRTVGKTRYQVAAVPLGGFVALVGETPDAEIPAPFTAAESFSLRPAWQRFLVIAAGSVFNLLLAWLICWGLMWTGGRSVIPPVVGEIIANSAAASSPLRPGDTVVSINGAHIETWNQMPPLVQKNGEKPMAVTVKRPTGETVTFSLTPTPLTGGNGRGGEARALGMGIRPKEVLNQSYSFLESAREGMYDAANMVRLTWKALAGLLTREIAADNVGGPIMIAQTIYDQAGHGLMNVLVIAALISVNLGVLNLLPIPVLDGGHLFFLLTEMITRHAVPPKVQEKAMMVGIVLLISLMVFATFNDVMRIVHGFIGS